MLVGYNMKVFKHFVEECTGSTQLGGINDDTLPHLQLNKDFPQKLGSVTFMCLLSPNIMQKNGEK